MNESGTDKNPPIQCPQCGAALPTAALEGLCPACLLKQGEETGLPPESLPFQPPALAEVARLFPQLEILAFIGKGGMGAVYQARQPALDRLVALKILPPQAAGGPGFAERFNREARALARLNHPNIVAVHEFGQAGGSPFFLMEFVDGLTLRQVERAGRLSPAEALRIVPQICEALQFAHDEGIVHRDIKPENILIDKKGRVKIADFGIAKIIGGGNGRAGSPLPAAGTGQNIASPGATPPSSSLTETRHALGTPHYMAPEQVEQPQTVDHRADIFSLGVVFYEMLTGQLPLGKFAPPSRKVQIDARLDEVVLRALEREPELRYQQAGEVKTEIDTISSTPPGDHIPVEHTRPRVSQPAPSPAGFPRSPLQVFAWLSLAFFILGLLGCPFLLAVHANESATAIFGGLALVLALIFGGITWREKIGRVIAILTLCLAGVFVIFVLIFIFRSVPLRRERAQPEMEANKAAESAAHEAQLKTVSEPYIRLKQEYGIASSELVDLEAEEAELEAQFTNHSPKISQNHVTINALRAKILLMENEMHLLEQRFPGLYALEATNSTSTNNPQVQTNRIQLSSTKAIEKSSEEAALRDIAKRLMDAENEESLLEQHYRNRHPKVIENLALISGLKNRKKVLEDEINGLGLPTPTNSTSNVIFSVVSPSGAAPLSYQWYFDGSNLGNNLPETATKTNQ